MTEQAQQGNMSQKPTSLPTNLNVPVKVLTKIFHDYARRATNSRDKHYLFGIVEGLGTAIAQQGKGGGGLDPGNAGGFTMEEWFTECGVDPNWSTIAA